MNALALGQLALGGAGLFGANKAQKQQSKLLKAQTGIANFQLHQQQQYAPEQANALAYYRQRAGLDPGALAGGQGALGLYNSPEYSALRSKAEEQISHFAQGQRQQLEGGLAGRGLLGSSIQGGGLAAIGRGAESQYADYLRNLAIQAPHDRDQLVNQYYGALQGPLTGGQQAAQIYGNLAGQYGQQAQAGYAGLGSALSSYTQNEALRRIQQQQSDYFNSQRPGNYPINTPQPTQPVNPALGQQNGNVWIDNGMARDRNGHLLF